MGRVFLSVGDISAANYVYEIFKEGFDHVSKVGITNYKLESIGIRPVAKIEDISLVGLIEVLPKLKKLRAIYKRVLRELGSVDTLIACDAPGFNLRLIKDAREMGVRRIIYFISPQVWAWKPGRAEKIAKYADELVVILPFEVDFYRKLRYSSLRVHYVGHPLIDMVKPPLTQAEFFKLTGVKRDFVALLPGSRWGEIKRHAPILKELASNLSGVEFFIPTFETFKEYLLANLNLPNVKIFSDRDMESPSYNAMYYSKFSLIASGTASLEAGIAENPHVVFYRANPLTFWLGKRLVNLTYVSLVNILMNREIVPEVLQATPTALRGVTETFLSSEERLSEIRSELRELKTKLGNKGAINRLRELFLELI